MASIRSIQPKIETVDIIPVNVEVIAIAGFGLTGLLHGINLLQDGFQGILHIIDPRLGEAATRSSDVVPEVVIEYSKAIEPYGITVSSGNHIKDIENQAYRVFELLREKNPRCKVILHKQKFGGFKENKQIVLIDGESSSQLSLRVDLIIDATGTGRTVIQQFNQAIQKGILKDVDPFRIDTLWDQPLHFGFVRTLMSFKEFVQLAPFGWKLNESMDKVSHLANAVGLSSLYEWGYPIDYVPLFYLNALQHLKPNRSRDRFLPDELIKCNLYTMVPPELKVDQLHDYARTLLRWSQGDTSDKLPDLKLHNPSRKYPQKKPMLSVFSVDPTRVSPSMCLGNANTPIVLHTGDATINVPFTLGIGIRRGIERSQEGVRKSFFIGENGKLIGINKKRLEEYYQNNIAQLSVKVNGHREFLRNTKEMESRILKELSEASQVATGTNKLKIENALNKFRMKAEKNLSNAAEHLKQALGENKEVRRSDPEALINFDKSIEFLIAVSNFDLSEKIKKIAIQVAGEIVNQARLLGNQYMLSPTNYSLAEGYYIDAINICSYYLPQLDINEKLILYANLIDVCYKRLNYDKVLEIAERCETEVLSKIKNLDNKQIQIVDKLAYQHAKALLFVVKKKFRENEVDLLEIDNLLANIQRMIPHVLNQKCAEEIREEFELLTKQKNALSSVVLVSEALSRLSM